MTDITKETKDIRNRIWWLLIFFILSIASGIYTLMYPSIVGYFAIILSFFIYNGIMLIFKANQLGFRRIMEKLEEKKK